MASDVIKFVTTQSIFYLDADVSLGQSGKNNEQKFKLGTLFGTEHPWFWKVHITALISLGISIVFSFGTLIFLWSSGKNWNIFKRKFSERLAVYLAVADILYSLEHSFGHIYAMVAAYNNGNFDENICYLSGFMLLEFSCGQGFIITVTALSAFLMVVLNRKITFGRNDWMLLVGSFGIPAVPGVIFAVLGWFGPSGFWCFADYSSAGGPILALFHSLFPLGVTCIITVCYVGVWVTIQISHAPQTWEECLISSLTRLYDALPHQVNNVTTQNHLLQQLFPPRASEGAIDWIH